MATSPVTSCGIPEAATPPVPISQIEESLKKKTDRRPRRDSNPKECDDGCYFQSDDDNCGCKDVLQSIESQRRTLSKVVWSRVSSQVQQALKDHMDAILHPRIDRWSRTEFGFIYQHNAQQFAGRVTDYLATITREETDGGFQYSYPKRLIEIAEKMLVFLCEEVFPIVDKFGDSRSVNDDWFRHAAEIRRSLGERYYRGLLREGQVRLVEIHLLATMDECRRATERAKSDPRLHKGLEFEIRMAFCFCNQALLRFFLHLRSERIEQLILRYVGYNSSVNEELVKGIYDRTRHQYERGTGYFL
ncbi:hypothetical protein BJ508DRAFT_416387 [Ascobolus immersus RN42]|uniref:Uncharacterized protein n=1 Tax=Ascobolus immersus RN42 TaxID=1160509 RepID=A0A3N4I2A5_ASCIM|nr:hypothetical protein BJ508DRAFT_416387 [Ascobolus immersus RN42]